MPRLLIILLLFFFCSPDRIFGGLSKKVFVRNFTVDNGLPQNSVNDLLQDDEGYIWVSTAAGVRRTDGIHFYDFQGSSGQIISDLQTAQFVSDKAGNVWIISPVLIARYDLRTRNIRIIKRFPAKLASDFIVILNRNRSGTISIYKQNEGLYEINTGALSVRFAGKRPFFFTSGKALYYEIPQPDSSRFMYYQDDHIYCIDLKSYTEQVLLQTDTKNKQADFFFNEELRKIILPALKLSTAKSSTEQIAGYPTITVTDSSIYFRNDILNDNGYQWINMVGKNFSTGVTVTKMIKDRCGNFWIGSTNTGLWLINQKDSHFMTWDHSPHTGSFVKSLQYDEKHNRVLATYYNGGFAFFGIRGTFIEDYRAYGNSDLVANKNMVNALQTDSNTYLLVSEEYPCFYQLSLKEKTITEATISGNHPSNGFTYYSSQAKLGSHEFLITSRNDLLRIEDANRRKIAKTIYTNQKTLAGTYTTGNRIYAGYSGGYDELTLSGTRIRSYSLVNNPEARVKDFVETPDGKLFIATTNGLYTATDKQTLQKISGLTERYFYNVILVGRSELWLTTNRGILAYDYRTKNCRQFTSVDGFVSNECNSNCFCRLPDGRMLAGTTAGISEFDPESINNAEPPLPPAITAIYTLGSGLKTDTADPRLSELKLPYKRHKIMISVADLSFTPPEHALFRYRLSESDSVWQELRAGNEFSLSLQPGSYSLEIQTGNIKNNKFSTSTTLKMTIAQPYWMQWWFFALEFAVFSGLIYLTAHLIHRNKIKKIMQQLQLHHALQNERERISRELHDNLGAQATTLNANLRDLQSMTLPDADNAALARVAETGKSIMQNLRESIWALNNEYITVTSLCDRYKAFAKNILKSYPGIKIQFREDFSNEIELKPATALNILRILQEALHNTLKHAEASEIEITFSTKQGICITYADNGVGFNKQQQKAESYGLNNMRQRAADAGVDLSVDNGEKCGMLLIIKQTNQSKL